MPLTAANAGTDRKILDSGATTLIISDEEIGYIMKIVKYLEDSGLSIKDIIQQSIKMKQRDGFLNILLGILGACLLGNRLAGKGQRTTSEGRGFIQVGDGVI